MNNHPVVSSTCISNSLIAMVSQQIFIWTIGGLISGGLILAGGIYANRRRINKLYQRLFGLDMDDTDHGYIIEINDRTQEMKEQMQENQEKIENAHDMMAEKLDEINGDN